MSKQISSVELKKLELEIAKEVKKICDENNIDYFIIGGTLLGAETSANRRRQASQDRLRGTL